MKTTISHFLEAEAPGWPSMRDGEPCISASLQQLLHDALRGREDSSGAIDELGVDAEM